MATAAARATAAPPPAAAPPRPRSGRGFEPSLEWDPHVAAYLSAALGRAAFRRVSAALCRPPLRTCVRVNTLKADAEEVARELEAELSSTGAAADDGSGGGGGGGGGRENSGGGGGGGGGSASGSGSGGGARRIGRVDGAPMVLMLPGSGPHAVDYSETGGREVLISRRAGEAVLRGAQLFVPGVLAATAGLEAGALVAVRVAIERRGVGGGGGGGVGGPARFECTHGTVLPLPPPGAGSSGAGGEAEGGGGGGGLYIGVGRMLLGRAELFRARSGVAVEMVRRVYDVPSVPERLRGRFMLQNLPSVAAALALAPAPGARVIDLCASPGGKSTLLAALMGNRGEVVAVDRTHNKVDGIRALADELGCTCVKPLKMDSTRSVLPPRLCPGEGGGGGGGGEDPASGAAAAGPEGQPAEAEAAAATAGGPISAKALQRLQRRAASMRARGMEPPEAELRAVGLGPRACPGFPPASFDFVLLDAPCTGLGLRPRLLMQATLQELRSTAHYQRRLIDRAVALLRPGGAMVYSTCTINPGENEANVRYLLDKHPCMRLDAPRARLGGPGLAAPADAAALRAAARACYGPRVGGAGAGAGAAEGEGPAAGGGEGSGGGGGAEAAGGAARGGGRAPPGEQAEWPPFGVESDLPPSGAWLTAEEASLVQRFDPAGPDDTIGFFAARFVKAADAGAAAGG
ncbi:hypothetical protein Rsub_04128 [Raphidocelis subcapitata]|uniref:SAM-dependent MTase RsmB/NOP-type domain-containing protein n=1 Tax=Raphidocelis subcapitata TaxID=307507 RepID=A0A2V0NUR9_9CHLO|nr:hypothetical protein Rsub_04128 [Raphidocelis subcapitata]|eukprot:GBF91388.1 hypothetical protein Rsub_04128 [Raphidocelis subcapitata]